MPNKVSPQRVACLLDDLMTEHDNMLMDRVSHPSHVWSPTLPGLPAKTLPALCVPQTALGTPQTGNYLLPTIILSMVQHRTVAGGTLVDPVTMAPLVGNGDISVGRGDGRIP